MSNTIQVQVRIRPPGANPAMAYDPQQGEYYNIDYNDEILQLMQDVKQQNLISPQKGQADQNTYNFKFNKVYGPKTT